MEFSQVYDIIVAKDGVTESFPFDEQTLVFKIGGKIFALLSLEKEPLNINLKCDPDRAEILREAYPAITAGYHMNKKHWNTLVLDSSLNQNIVVELIQHSYDLVKGSLPKKQQELLSKTNETN